MRVVRERLAWVAWVVAAVCVAGARAAEPPAALLRAAQAHGEAGGRAARFLWDAMPAADRASVPPEWLAENLDLAFRARDLFPWGRAIPEERFLNDVLPYAFLDEPRSRWRRELMEIAGPLVAGCGTASDAAAALNRELFDRVGVRYSTGRARPNQGPTESIASGKASCTGLAILWASACRAVGVPARLVGTARWTGKEGNHTWAEIWDGDWRFAGAGEPDPGGWNRGWFVGDAARAVPGDPERGIYATTWARGDGWFPLAWAPGERTVAAVEVTGRYRDGGAPGEGGLHFRIWERRDAGRIASRVALFDGAGALLGEGRTRGDSSDLNDMPSFPVARRGSGEGRLWAERDGVTREWKIEAGKPGTHDLEWGKGHAVSAALAAFGWWVAGGGRGALPEGELGRDEAERVAAWLWEIRKAAARPEVEAVLEAREVVSGSLRMPWIEKVFGEAPEKGRSLWISMHGGGGAPAEVNDQQWRNQARLYRPAEGFYVAPRAPTNEWNLWHEAHIDGMLDRLIAAYVVGRGVDPDRVYLLGYSAGGDGVYQVAPRTADRWAAAAMMAGHPNESTPDGLRNLPFMIFVGGQDEAYRRNAVAVEWGEKLDALERADPGGYPHRTTVYPECEHWMEGRDAEALPWMAARVREPWPRRVVWKQDDVTHRRFYWLSAAGAAAVKDARVVAEVEGQTVRIKGVGEGELAVRMRDGWIDLDRPVRVVWNGRQVFSGRVGRRAPVIGATLAERLDPRTAAFGEVKLGGKGR
jgi:transglutaminase-like putative cysteine protease